jgi:hypothetical protein
MQLSTTAWLLLTFSANSLDGTLWLAYFRENSWASCFLSVQAALWVHLSLRKQLHCCFPQMQTARLVHFSNFISVQIVELAHTLSADSSGDTRVVRFYRFKQLGWLFIICENSSVGTLR